MAFPIKMPFWGTVFNHGWTITCQNDAARADFSSRSPQVVPWAGHPLPVVHELHSPAAWKIIHIGQTCWAHIVMLCHVDTYDTWFRHSQIHIWNIWNIWTPLNTNTDLSDLMLIWFHAIFQSLSFWQSQWSQLLSRRDSAWRRPLALKDCHPWEMNHDESWVMKCFRSVEQMWSI